MTGQCLLLARLETFEQERQFVRKVPETDQTSSLTQSVKGLTALLEAKREALL